MCSGIRSDQYKTSTKPVQEHYKTITRKLLHRDHFATIVDVTVR